MAHKYQKCARTAVILRDYIPLRETIHETAGSWTDESASAVSQSFSQTSSSVVLLLLAGKPSSYVI